jgi:hypothetical protein
MLTIDGRPNVLAVVFEDASASDDAPGEITTMALRYNDERFDWDGASFRRGIAAAKREPLTISFR